MRRFPSRLYALVVLVVAMTLVGAIEFLHESVHERKRVEVFLRKTHDEDLADSRPEGRAEVAQRDAGERVRGPLAPIQQRLAARVYTYALQGATRGAYTDRK